MNKGWIPSVADKMRQKMSKVGVSHIQQMEENCSKFRCISSVKLNKNSSWEAETVDFMCTSLQMRRKFRRTLIFHLILISSWTHLGLNLVILVSSWIKYYIKIWLQTVLKSGDFIIASLVLPVTKGIWTPSSNRTSFGVWVLKFIGWQLWSILKENSLPISSLSSL